MPVVHQLIAVYDAADLARIDTVDPESAQYNSELGISDAEIAAHAGAVPALCNAIQRLKNHPLGTRRKLLVPQADNLLQTTRAFANLRHLAALEEIVSNAVRLAIETKTPVELPPLLLVGAPGGGKSWIANRIGEAIGAKPVVISMATISDITTITGRSSAWRNPGLGRIASEILLGDIANPFFVLDELEKIREPGSERPGSENVLHSLIEPENARIFRDELLDLPFDASHAFWLMTANDASTLPPSLLDRMLVFEVPELDAATKRNVARDMFSAANARRFDYFAPPQDELYDAIAAGGLRQARRMIALAMGRAVEQGRKSVTADDVAAVAKTVSPPERKIGF